MAQAEDITNLIRGVYRRHYSGYVNGKRINSISLNAEAWFWRLHDTADDFGNGHADPEIAFNNTVGRRKGVTVDQVDGWINECSVAVLIRIYRVGDESFYHVVGYLTTQPAGKNGKRVRRVPASPFDDDSDISDGSGFIPVNPKDSNVNDTTDEHEPVNDRNSGNREGLDADGSRAPKSGGIRVNPVESSASDTHTDTHSDSDSDTDTHSACGVSDADVDSVLKESEISLNIGTRQRAKVREMVEIGGKAKTIEALDVATKEMRYPIRRALSYALGIVSNQESDRARNGKRKKKGTSAIANREDN